MKDKSIIYACAFTGHRPQKLPWRTNENDEKCIILKQKIKNAIIYLIDKRQVNYFISGMAQRIDTYVAEMVLELKLSKIISLECAIPCDNQTKGWTEKEVIRYNSILAKADKITYVSHGYSKDCMMKRNRYMVDNSDFLIGVWDGQNSGTANTIKYAQEKNKHILIIEPNTLKQRELNFTKV